MSAIHCYLHSSQIGVGRSVGMSAHVRWADLWACLHTSGGRICGCVCTRQVTGSCEKQYINHVMVCVCTVCVHSMSRDSVGVLGASLYTIHFPFEVLQGSRSDIGSTTSKVHPDTNIRMLEWHILRLFLMCIPAYICIDTYTDSTTCTVEPV